MKKMFEKEIKFTIKEALAKTIATVLVVFGILAWVSPNTINTINTWRGKITEKKEVTMEVESETKELLKIYKCDDLFVVLYTDDSYYAASTLDEAATVLTDATGKAFAASNGNLYEVEGGKLNVVKVDVYR